MADATDLSVILELSRSHAPQDPYAFRFEPQAYSLRTEGGGREVIEIDWAPELLADLEEMRRADRDPVVVQRLGETMARFLERASWPARGRAIAEAHDAGRRVLVTIRSNAAELNALPWELLTLPGRGQHLAELSRVLLRYERPETRSATEIPSPRPEGGRILMAWSAAAGAVPAAEHEAALRGACLRGHPKGEEALHVLAHASIRAIADTLTRAERAGRPFSVLHLLCHGGQTGQVYGLVLDGDSRPATVAADTWRTLLAPHASSLRLAVLAACDGGDAGEPGNHLGSVAQALHAAGFEAVVASRYPLSSAGSITLAESLYGGLLVEHESLEEALLRARARLALDPSRLDWAAVQLHARAQDGSDMRPFVFRPYRGLLAFEAQQTPFFHGREEERQEVLQDLEALVEAGKPRLLVVAGASGTGKSSLVRAGAVPDILATRGGTWEHAIIRPGEDPLGTLEATLSEREDEGAPFLLVVDQFEEIFTHNHDRKVRLAFARRLWTLASEDTGIHCILALRVDFLGRCGELRLDDEGTRLDAVAYDEAHRVFVARMASKSLMAAITRPAQHVGLTLQEGLAQRIVAEVGVEPGVLPLLQYTLDLIWQVRRGRELRVDAYEELGGVVGSLECRADALLEALADVELLQARRMLVLLVGVGDDDTGDRRRRMPIEQLWPVDPGQRSVAEAVLRRLVDERLVVRDDRTRGGTTVEIAHEALIHRWDRLREWLGDERERRIGRYIALEEIREGGRVQTYLGYDPDLDRRVTITLFRIGRRGAQERERLRDQAQALARLSHPNALAVYDVGVAKGHVYMATELGEGTPLRSWGAERSRPWPTVVAAFVQVADALAAAHRLGLVHRAVSPDVVQIDGEGIARIEGFSFDRRPTTTDTGRSARTIAARAQAQSGGGASSNVSPRPSSPLHVVPSELLSMTESSTMDQPAYRPPEQLRGLPLGPAGDQFSLCVSLYEMLYGGQPLSGGGMAALVGTVTAPERAVKAPGARVPEQLRKILLRGLAADPDERWPSMEVLGEELSRVALPEGRNKRIAWLGLAGLALGTGMLMWSMVPSGDEISGCSELDTRLEGVWDAAQRRAARDALFGTARPHAVPTWTRIEPWIDNYAEAWSASHAGLCTSSGDAGGSADEENLGLRRACLDNRRIELREVVEVLIDADVEVLERAVPLVEGLPALEGCDDLERLRAQAPNPDDPEVRARAELLVVARTRRRGGDAERAEVEAQAVLSSREGNVAQRAEALLERGAARWDLGREVEAIADLEEAVSLALQHGVAAIATRAAIRLASIAVEDPAGLGRAITWGKVGLALSAGPLADARDRAAAQTVMGTLLYRGGEAGRAREHVERGLALLRETLGSQHPLVAASHIRFAEVALARGDFALAREHAEHAVEIRESGAGGTADLAQARFALARALWADPGEHERAWRYAEQARRAYAALGESRSAEVEHVQAWIDEHG